MEILWSWNGVLKNKEDMLPWADKITPGLSKFIQSCNGYMKSGGSLAITWGEIKTFRDTPEKLTCHGDDSPGDIGKHTEQWMWENVPAVRKALYGQGD